MKRFGWEIVVRRIPKAERPSEFQAAFLKAQKRAVPMRKHPYFKHRFSR